MTAAEILVAAGYQKRLTGRASRLAEVLADHPDAVLVRCVDERTGRRFGEAMCRVGRCKKIGRTTYQYQLWASWAACDRGGAP